MSSAEREALQGHLDRCPECATRLEVERSFERGLRARLSSHSAPPGLSTRVRASLREQAGPPSIRSPAWWRRAWLPTAAAIAMLAGLLFIAPLSAPEAVPGELTVRGLVVDHDCDRAGLDVADQRNCSDPTHLNVLKLEDGRYVRFTVVNGPGRPDLLHDREVRGTELALAGDYVPATRTVHVRDIRGL